MSTWVFPVKKAYDYVLRMAPHLADDVESIRSTRVEDQQYGGTTQYRRARMIKLLKDNGLWEGFCQREWPEGDTPQSHAILNELREAYPQVLDL